MTSEDLGAQNAVCGGGRYDGLVEELGGPPTPAIGFAVVLERLLQLTNMKDSPPEGGKSPIEIFIVALGKRAEAESLALASDLRERGLRTDRAFGGGSMKSQMKRANRSGARYVLMVGEDEISKGVVSLRDMIESRQEEISREEIKADLKETVMQQMHIALASMDRRVSTTFIPQPQQLWTNPELIQNTMGQPNLQTNYVHHSFPTPTTDYSQGRMYPPCLTNLQTNYM